MRVVIVIPTYNEADNLIELLSRIQELDVKDLTVLIVDDNSPDGTGQIADLWAERHPDRLQVIKRERKLGLASAYVTGFRRALTAMGADIVMQMDADLSHDPDVIPTFLARVKDAADLVIGSRYAPGGQVDHSWDLGRRLLSR